MSIYSRLICFGIFNLLLTFDFGAYAQQVSVSPSILRFNLLKGGNDAKTIKITNRSNLRQSMVTSIGDWYRDSLGNHVYLKPGEMKRRSNAAFVTVTPSFIEIEPNETAEVLVSVQMPADSTFKQNMTWSMLFIQGTVEKTNPFVPENQLATQIREKYRFGVHVYNTPSNLKEVKATLEEFNISEKNDSSRVIKLKSKNIGDVILKCKTYLEITNLNSAENITVDPDEFTIFPQEFKVSYFTLPKNLNSGEYSILGILDFGDNQPLEAIEKNITVP